MQHRGVVAAGHPETVRAAVETLEAGGNAYDAVVAAGMAASVAEPGLTSLGGGGFLLASTVAGEEVVFDFFVDTPGRELPSGEIEPHFTPVTVSFKGADQVFHAGYGSVAVPGCLVGYLHIHRRLGCLPLDRVVAPALRLADEGVVVSPLQAEIFGLLAGIFTLTDEGRRVFCRDGRLLGEGDTFRNPELAQLFAGVGSGRIRGFADPPVGDAIDDDMAGNSGLLTKADLVAYRVVEREPLVASYRGARVVTNPPPSFGGGLVARALGLLEEGAPGSFADPGQVGRIATALRSISEDHAGGHPPAGVETPPGVERRARSSKGTTHISIADSEGNVAAMTTSNGSCSGVFAPGTGVQLNNIMGEEDLHPDGFHSAPAGVRVGSMMAPTIIHSPDGRVIALGSGGSERIRSTLTQVVVNILDHGFSLEQAVEAPRLHWERGTLQVEGGYAEPSVSALASSMAVNVWEGRNLYFGGAHAVSTAGEAAGDARRGGSTAVLV